MHDDPPEEGPRSDRVDRSPFDVLVDYACGRARTLRDDDTPARDSDLSQAAAADDDSPDGAAADAVSAHIDGRAWLLAIVAFAGLVVFDLVWALVHGSSAMELVAIVSWSALGLAATIVVGRRWAGAWALYLLWAAPWVVDGVAALLTPLFGSLVADRLNAPGDLSSGLIDRSLSVPAVAALAAGALLCYSALRQGRVWSETVPAPHPERVDDAAARAVFLGAGVVLFGYVIAEASISGLIYASLGLVGGRDTLIVTLVAVVALLAPRMPVASLWVFALAGVYEGAGAVQALARLPWALHIGGGWEFVGAAWATVVAVVLAGIAQLVWAGFVLYAARRQYQLTRPGASTESPQAHAGPPGSG